MSPTTLANAFSKDSSATAVIVPGSPALHVSYQKLSADVKAFQQQLANVGVSAQAAVRSTLHQSINEACTDFTLSLGLHRAPQYIRVHRLLYCRIVAASDRGAPEPSIQAVGIRILHR